MKRSDKIKSIRKKLLDGLPSIGSWIQIPHASVAEIMGDSGYDWIAVDMEHGAISSHQLPDLFRAIDLGAALPLVRLARGHSVDCKQALDAGAGGVIVPMIESASHLVEVRDACRWPPAGTRGVGFSRANLFGMRFDSYFDEAQAPLLVAMIENVDAVAALEEILQVDGLDALLIGPYDLSASMGIVSQFDTKQFKDVLEDILQKCQEHGVPCGLHVVDPKVEDLQEKVQQGYRFLAYSIDSVFLSKAAECPSLP